MSTSSLVDHSSTVMGLGFLRIQPPSPRRIGMAETPAINPMVQPIVPQPALSRMNPAKKGPIRLPAANPIFDSPNAKPIAPPRPNMPGERFPLSSTALKTSVTIGGMETAMHTPIKDNSAQSRTL